MTGGFTGDQPDRVSLGAFLCCFLGFYFAGCLHAFAGVFGMLRSLVKVLLDIFNRELFHLPKHREDSQTQPHQPTSARLLVASVGIVCSFVGAPSLAGA